MSASQEGGEGTEWLPLTDDQRAAIRSFADSSGWQPFFTDAFLTVSEVFTSNPEGAARFVFNSPLLTHSLARRLEILRRIPILSSNRTDANAAYVRLRSSSTMHFILDIAQDGKALPREVGYLCSSLLNRVEQGQRISDMAEASRQFSAAILDKPGRDRAKGWMQSIIRSTPATSPVVLASVAEEIATDPYALAVCLLHSPFNALLFVNQVNQWRVEGVGAPVVAVVDNSQELSTIFVLLEGEVSRGDASRLCSEARRNLQFGDSFQNVVSRIHPVYVDPFSPIRKLIDPERSGSPLSLQLDRATSLIDENSDQIMRWMTRAPGSAARFSRMVTTLRNAENPDASVARFLAAVDASPSLGSLVELLIAVDDKYATIRRVNQFKRLLDQGLEPSDALATTLERPTDAQLTTAVREFMAWNVADENLMTSAQRMAELLEQGGPHAADYLARHSWSATQLIRRAAQLRHDQVPAGWTIWRALQSNSALHAVAQLALKDEMRRGVVDHFRELRQRVSSGESVVEAVRSIMPTLAALEERVLESHEEDVVKAFLASEGPQNFPDAVRSFADLTTNKPEAVARFLVVDVNRVLGVAHGLRSGAPLGEETRVLLTQLREIPVLGLLVDLSDSNTRNRRLVSAQLARIRDRLDGGELAIDMAAARQPFSEALQEGRQIFAEKLSKIVRHSSSSILHNPSIASETRGGIAQDPYGLAVYLAGRPGDAEVFLRTIAQWRRQGVAREIVAAVEGSLELRTLASVLDEGTMRRDDIYAICRELLLELNAGATFAEAAVDLQPFRSTTSPIGVLLRVEDAEDVLETQSRDAVSAIVHRRNEIVDLLTHNPHLAIDFTKCLKLLRERSEANPNAAALLAAIDGDSLFGAITTVLRRVDDQSVAQTRLNQLMKEVEQGRDPADAAIVVVRRSTGKELATAMNKFMNLGIANDTESKVVSLFVAELLKHGGPEAARQLLQNPQRTSEFVRRVVGRRQVLIPGAIDIWRALQNDPSLKAASSLALVDGTSMELAALFSQVRQLVDAGGSLAEVVDATTRDLPRSSEPLSIGASSQPQLIANDEIADAIYVIANFDPEGAIPSGPMFKYVGHILRRHQPALSKHLLAHPLRALLLIRRADEFRRSSLPGAYSLWGVLQSDASLKAITTFTTADPTSANLGTLSEIRKLVDGGVSVARAVEMVTRRIDQERASDLARQHGQERLVAETPSVDEDSVAREPPQPIVLAGRLYTPEEAADQVSKLQLGSPSFAPERLDELATVLEQAPDVLLELLVNRRHYSAEGLATLIASEAANETNPVAFRRIQNALLQHPALQTVFRVASGETVVVKRVGWRQLKEGLASDGLTPEVLQGIEGLTEADARFAEGDPPVTREVVNRAIGVLHQNDAEQKPYTSAQMAPLEGVLRRDAAGAVFDLLSHPGQIMDIVARLDRVPESPDAVAMRARLLTHPVMADLNVLAWEELEGQVSNGTNVGRFREIRRSNSSRSYGEQLKRMANGIRRQRGMGGDDDGSVGGPPSPPSLPPGGDTPGKSALREPRKTAAPVPVRTAADLPSPVVPADDSPEVSVGGAAQRVAGRPTPLSMPSHPVAERTPIVSQSVAQTSTADSRMSAVPQPLDHQLAIVTPQSVRQAAPVASISQSSDPGSVPVASSPLGAAEAASRQRPSVSLGQLAASGSIPQADPMPLGHVPRDPVRATQRSREAAARLSRGRERRVEVPQSAAEAAAQPPSPRCSGVTAEIEESGVPLSFFHDVVKRAKSAVGGMVEVPGARAVTVVPEPLLPVDPSSLADAMERPPVMPAATVVDDKTSGEDVKGLPDGSKSRVALPSGPEL